MAFPSGIAALAKVFQTTDGAQVETYTVPATGPYTHQLGSTLVPAGYAAYPAGWALIPDGAFSISAPAAFSASNATTGTGNLLGGIYKYALTEVTDYGETLPGPTLTTATITAGSSYTLNLPAVGGTAANPVRKRRLYRSLVGGTTLYLLAEITDLAALTYTDYRNDTGLNATGAAIAPATNTSGWLPPGNAGPVQVSIGAPLVAATEVASSPATGQYVIDYIAGVVTHAAGDAGKAAQATITAATLINASMLNSVITSLKEIQTAFGAASGFATLDGTGKLVQAVANAGVASGLATLDTNTKVVQHSSWEGVASGVPTLDATSKVVQHSAVEGVASGVATLNASSLVVQDPASKALANGVCDLDATGKVPAARIPAGGTTAQSGVGYDSGEASSSTGTASLIDNLNHLRYQLGQIFGGSWNAAVQMLPLSQKAAASGVASLDANSHTLQREVYDATEASTMDVLGATSTLVNNLNRLRNQLGVVIGNAGTSWNAAVQMIPLSQKAAASGVASLDANIHTVQQPVHDATEASTFDTLGATSSVVNNLNRLRNQLGVVIGNAGTSWNAAVQMIPLSQKAANSGVASLNASGFLVQALAKGVRQIVTYQPASDLTVIDNNLGASLTYANWAHLVDVAISGVQSGSSIAVLVTGNPYNFLTTTGNWCRMAAALDAASVQMISGQVSTAGTSAPFGENGTQGTTIAGLAFWTGVSSGAHNVNLLMNAGGAASPSAGFKANSAGTGSFLSVIVIEFA